jgi:hypothetical protein
MARQRPTSVTVLGVINIIFGVLGATSSLGSLSLLVSGAGEQAQGAAAPESPVFEAWSVASVPLGLLAAAAIIAAGIGFFMLRPWARILAIGWSIYTIVMVIAGIAMAYIFVVAPMMAEAETTVAPAIAATAGGLCCGVIYPVILLAFMYNADVRAAFEQY